MHRYAIGASLAVLFMLAGWPARGEERWGGLFAPYPGARRLCSQHISGHAGGKPMHITWVAFASTDAPEKVSAFYAKNTAGAKVERSSHGLTQLRGPKGQVLSVMVAARKGYPTCEVKPAASDHAVIIVSNAATP
jgi:hypothetical protein